MGKMGAARKAIIFTESRRTQEYLEEYLEANGYKDKLVLFSGTNTDPLSTSIYQKWLKENEYSNKISGSTPVDRRTALTDAFKNQAEIMMATGAADRQV